MRHEDNRGVRVVSLLVVLTVMGTGLSGCLGGDDDEEDITIGAILSLTGPGSFIGSELRDGMLMAAAEINADGGVNGRDIDIEVKDSKTNATEGEKAFETLEKDEEPLLYVSCLSSVSMAVAPLAEQDKVMLMGLVVTATEVTQGRDWVYRYWPNAEDEIPPVLASLQDQGAKNISVLYVNDAYGNNVFNTVNGSWTGNGKSVLAVPFELGDSDYSGYIETFNDTDGVYITGYDSHVQAILPQVASSNYTGLVAVVNAVTLPSSRELPASDGVYTSAPGLYKPDFAFAREAGERFQTRYGRPFTHFSASGYDFIMMLASLLEDEKVSRENVKALFDQGFTYPGVFGDIDVAAGSHDFSFQQFPAQIREGEVHYL